MNSKASRCLGWHLMLGLAIASSLAVAGCSSEETQTPQKPTAQSRTQNALFASAAKGDLAGIRKALQNGANLNAENKEGSTPLMLATQNGSLECVRELLSKGADPNLTDSPTKNTPLHIAGMNGLTSIARELLAHHANPRAETRDGSTPADVAREAGHGETAKLLKDAEDFL